MNVTTAKVDKQWAYTKPLLSCVFSPDGKFLFTSAEDFTIQRWDLVADKPVVLSKHESWVQSMSFTADGTRLVSGGYEGKLIWWPIEGQEAERVVEAHQGWIRSVVGLKDGRIATAGNDRVIRLWNGATGEKVGELSGHEKHIYSLLAHPNGTHLLSGDLQGKLHLWNLAESKIERSFDAAPLFSYNAGQQVDFGGVRSMSLNADQTQLVAGGVHKSSNPFGAVHEPLVLRFDWQTGNLLKSHVAQNITGGVAWRLQFLSDGTLCGVTGGSSGGWLLFWNQEADATMHQLQLPNLARDMSLHPDGVRLATVHHDRHVRIVVFA